MAVTMSDISKLRKLTGAGMMDCKKALEETNCDMDAAVEIIRKKGQAVAAKREDREASEGCVEVRDRLRCKERRFRSLDKGYSRRCSRCEG